jgi:hypothetical protein
MVEQFNLKDLERKAFRSTYQDGLYDIYFGLIVICISFFVYRPASGYSPLNIFLMLGALAVSYSLFWAGKKYITLPRMGQVQFGVQRKKRKQTMVIILGVVVLIQVVFLGIQLIAMRNPGLGAKVNEILPEGKAANLLIASIGAMFVGPSMILVAYFKDFPRGYFLAIMISLAVFLMISLNQPVYPIIIGVLMTLPGLVLFVRFLRKYPLHKETGHE